MMRSTNTLGHVGLGGADFKISIHCDRVAVHDFAMKPLSENNRESGLAASGRAQYYDQQRLGRHYQRTLHETACQERASVRMRISKPITSNPAASIVQMCDFAWRCFCWGSECGCAPEEGTCLF